MYLAYLDDSDTRAKDEHWKVVCAVLVNDDAFGLTELLSSFAIESLMPEERQDKFEEFHACELYRGCGPFEGIEQSKRFTAIEYLLTLLSTCEIQVTYGAVNVALLEQQPYASANPLDVAFRLCTQEIGNWLLKKATKEMENADIADMKAGRNLALLIADDCDKADKYILQNSFHSMRKRLRPPEFNPGSLQLLHDDLYFGDSRYSIGIQIADLCAYFIARHLMGHAEIEHFYKRIEPQLVGGDR